MICRFTNTTPTFENEKIKNIKNTNIAFVRPHIITIKKIKYFMFDECTDIFVNGYEEKIKFKDLEEYMITNFEQKERNFRRIHKRNLGQFE